MKKMRDDDAELPASAPPAVAGKLFAYGDAAFLEGFQR